MKMKISSVVLFCTTFLSFSSVAQLPEQDCINAIKVCQSVYVQSNSYQGYGQLQEIAASNNSCLNDFETNSSWYIFKVTTSGVINFQIDPVLTNDDYDFALFNITNNSCNDIIKNSLIPIRCNYSSTQGSTGLNTGYTSTSVSSMGPNQCAPLNVNAGETFALLVNNFTSTAGGYTLTFSGTANIFESVPPKILNASASSCSPKSVTVTFDEYIQCDALAKDGSDFKLTGPGNFDIASAASVSCNTNSLTKSVVLKFNSPLTKPGTYILTTQTGSDGNVVQDICGNEIASGVSISFTVDFVAPVSNINIYTNTNCSTSNGTATVTVNGGTSPYSYEWNTTPAQTTKKAVGLSSGYYEVTVTDVNGCKTISDIIINNINAPTVSLKKVEHLKCKFDKTGSIEIEVIGGKEPYAFSWNTNPVATTQNISNLSEGKYVCTVSDNNGCGAVLEVKLNSPPELMVSTSQTPSDCGSANGGVSAKVTGGVAPYSYLWSTIPIATTIDVNNLPAGIYSLTVTDNNNCVKFGNTYINNINGPDGYIVSTKNALCDKANGAVTVNANGTGPFNYIWNTSPVQFGNTAINLSASTYQVAISDAFGCIQILNVKINNISGPTASLNNVVHADCNASNGSATLQPIGGTPPYTYNWNTVPVQTTAVSTQLNPGNYQAFVTDSNGCNSSLIDFVISEFGGQLDFTIGVACENKEVKFLSTNTSKADTWVWDFGDVSSGSDNSSHLENPEHVFLLPGEYDVTLITDGVCGQLSTHKKIKVHANPQGFIASSPDELTATTQVLFKFKGDGAKYFYWNLGEGVTSEAPIASHTYSHQGEYDIQLHVVNEHGCMSDFTDRILVLPEPDIYVPSAFTPNSDGLNDHLRIAGRGVETLDFKIYNRWGEMLFSSDTIFDAMEIGWDGKINEKTQSGNQVYTYLLRGKFFNGKTFNKSGSIAVLP